MAVKNKTKKVAKRVTVTAPQAQAIRELADQVGKLISLEGYRSSFSLTSVAKEKGLTRYIPKKSVNKKEAFYGFLLNLHKHKPRTIKILIREILPVAIEKRHKKGDPVLEAEALELSGKLKVIGIDMTTEIAGMNLPKERPKTVPPPIAIQKILDTYVLHPSMLPDCKQMFIEGHINESVRKALERFEKLVQDLTSLHDKQGPDLMATAFSEQVPLIKVSNGGTSQEKNKQLGFKFTTMGLMHWWRNNLSHGDENQLPHHDALGRLIMISNLFHEVDLRII
ncbi:MAG: TIGR02391 family protein [Minisyncoccia bacterium]